MKWFNFVVKNLADSGAFLPVKAVSFRFQKIQIWSSRPLLSTKLFQMSTVFSTNQISINQSARNLTVEDIQRKMGKKMTEARASQICESIKMLAHILVECIRSSKIICIDNQYIVSSIEKIEDVEVKSSTLKKAA